MCVFKCTITDMVSFYLLRDLESRAINYIMQVKFILYNDLMYASGTVVFYRTAGSVGI